jgi:hypothetical protein
MQSVSTIGLDIAKSVFQAHGVDGLGQVVIHKSPPPSPAFGDTRGAIRNRPEVAYAGAASTEFDTWRLLFGSGRSKEPGERPR